MSMSVKLVAPHRRLNAHHSRSVGHLESHAITVLEQANFLSANVSPMPFSTGRKAKASTSVAHRQGAMASTPPPVAFKPTENLSPRPHRSCAFENTYPASCYAVGPRNDLKAASQ